MAKKFLFIAVSTLMSLPSFAQQTIVLKSGEKINGIVVASLKDGIINYTSKNYPKQIKISEVNAIYFYDEQEKSTVETVPSQPAVAPKEPGEKSVTYQSFNIRYKVADRVILKPPVVTNLTEQKGTVVLNIAVDKYGHVIKAVPGVDGSTTKSEYLYTKAKQAAESAQFDSAPTSALETKGYMIIQF